MRVLAITVFLASCAHPSPVPPPLETWEQQLQRVEGVTCADLTAHLDGEAPDCHAIVENFQKGRERVARIAEYSVRALGVRMNQIFWIRPKRTTFPEKPYPLINVMPEGVAPYYVAAITSAEGPVLIQYAYTDAIEHETTHAVVRILDPLRRRTDAAIALDQGIDASQPPLEFLFQVMCHGTPDDPLGVPGKRDSCDRSRMGYQP